MEEKKSRSRKFLVALNPFDYPERMLAFFMLSFLLLGGALFLAEGFGWMDSNAYILPVFCFGLSFFSLFGLVPVLLTLLNLSTLFVLKPTERIKKAERKIELTTILFGGVCSILWAVVVSPLASMYGGIVWKDYTEPLLYRQVHSPVATWTAPTLLVLLAVALIGYGLLKIKKLTTLPPLVATLALSALTIGIGLCVTWILQVMKNDWVLCVYPGNLAVIFLKTVKSTVIEFNHSAVHRPPAKNKFTAFLEGIVSHSLAWPFFAMLAALPLLGVLIALLMLFGQAPDNVLQAWTQTSDWTFSQCVSPPNLSPDMHYLCTVAASGHQRVVRPVRVGIRHGHKVLVNRQLCVANAFEQLLQEKLPRLHRVVRGAYDKYGYPMAKHIKSPFAADAIWFLMKPAEWFFLLVLYLFDPKPENRIAVQYPHAKIPK